MATALRDIAEACLHGSEIGTMTFPEIVGTLIAAGFDGYMVDLRRAAATYYLPDGSVIDLPAVRATQPVAAHFDATVVREAIREAQTQAPGYTYTGFCAKVAGAGCAGYLVSFPGRRVLYVGRTGETHTEHFPPAP